MLSTCVAADRILDGDGGAGDNRAGWIGDGAARWCRRCRRTGPTEPERQKNMIRNCCEDASSRSTCTYTSPLGVFPDFFDDVLVREQGQQGWRVKSAKVERLGLRGGDDRSTGDTTTPRGYRRASRICTPTWTVVQSGQSVCGYPRADARGLPDGANSQNQSNANQGEQESPRAMQTRF